MLLLLLAACTQPCASHAWYADADGDGFGDAPLGESCDVLGSTVPGDCDDGDASVHPGAPETCDSLDDDCDGTVDEGASGVATGFVDDDGDGFGGELASSCGGSYVATGGDCDDGNAAVHPGAEDAPYDGLDADCDGEDDDVDRDGWPAATDCDDTDPTVSPSATEICGNDRDDDCDGLGCALTGSATADAATLTVPPTTETWPASELTVADLDGDGVPEVITASAKAYTTTLSLADASQDLDAATLGTWRQDVADPLNGAMGDPVVTRDADGDGWRDLLVANDAQDGGTVWLVPGGPGEHDTALATIVGDAGNGGFGRRIAVSGDDVFVAAPWKNATGTWNGAVYLYKSPSGELATSDADDSRVGSPDTSFGSGLAVGDVDGDGLDDVLVGAPGDTPSNDATGHVDVWLGPVSLAANPDVRFFGTKSRGLFGDAILDPRDLDGDGYADVVVESNSSAARFGRLPADGSTVDVADATFPYDDLCRTLSDLDDDGHGEIAAPDARPSDGVEKGVVRLYSGASTGALATDDAWLTLSGVGEKDYFGVALGVGDVDGLGRDELVVLASGNQTVYVFDPGLGW